MILLKNPLKKDRFLLNWLVQGTGVSRKKKVLSPNITNIIQDQPSSNVQKQPSRVVVKKGKRYSLNV